MARMARIVIPNIPHHITQRGNRSQKVFFSGKDKPVEFKLLMQKILVYNKRLYISKQFFKYTKQ